MSRRLLIITPCRDEAEFLATTIRTVAAQTLRPARWIIVDDGSRDETPQVLEAASREHEFIEVVRREDRGRRAVGSGVIEAFIAGLERIDLDAYDYICKLDGDLELPPRYFERLVERFEADPFLGNCSGKAYLRYGDRLVHERRGDENAVGPSKLYRVACFRDIGGFVPHASWDGIDGHRCRMHGWVAQSVDEPELRFVHLRRTGSSQRSFWTGRMRWGLGKWYMGSAWYYVLLVSIYRMLERPYVISGAGILYGYVRAMVRRYPRYGDLRFRRFLRRYELRSAILGKRRVTEQEHRRIRAAGDGASVLAVASGGGHWVQLLRAMKAFEPAAVTYVTVRPEYRSDVPGRPFHVINDATRWNKLAAAIMALRLLLIVLRLRPDVVVTTGAAPGYFALRFGRWLGARTIWLDSIANAETLSMAGRMAGRYADLWLTQWPHLARPGGPEYAGAVM